MWRPGATSESTDESIGMLGDIRDGSAGLVAGEVTVRWLHV